MTMLMSVVFDDSDTFRETMDADNVPPPLNAEYEKPDKTQAAASLVTRYYKK